MRLEWEKLEGYPAWKFETVQEREQVVKDAKETRIKKPDHQIHLARLIVLCHLKNAQLDQRFWAYKGRIVLGGDQIKNEDNQFAVFSEQGTAASHLMAARFLDALARMPGMAGQDADATGAYTQNRIRPRLPSNMDRTTKE